MKKQLSKKLVFLSTVVILVLACELPGLTSPASSSSESAVSIETMIVGTAAAAQTQTALSMPLSTYTASPTPISTATPSTTPTPTATIIFIIPTATKPFEPGNVGKGCELVALTPYNPVLNPGKNFDITWTLKNTGNDIWLQDNVDFSFSGGTDMHRKDVYDLPSSVPPQGQTAITVAMVAPSKSGEYTTTWVLGSKKQTFCKVSVKAIVR